MFKKTLLVVALITAAVGLTGCGAEGQDKTKIEDVQHTSFTGLVIDGRIAGGTVWVDKNQDGQIDGAFESQAETDAEGYFSYNPTTAIDYCTDPADVQKYKHCLVIDRIPGASSTADILRVKGGIDLDTNEPLVGVMSVSTDGTTGDAIISPLSSLYAVTPADQRESLLISLGLVDENGDGDADDLTIDYTTDTTLKAQQLHGKAFALQQISGLLGARLKKGLGDSNVSIDQQVIKAMVTVIVKKQAENIAFADFTNSDFDEVFVQSKINLETELAGNDSEIEKVSAITTGRLGERSKTLSTLIAGSLTNSADLTPEERKGALQAAAAVAIQIKKEAEDLSDSDHSIAIDRVTDQTTFDNMVTALSTAATGGDEVNLVGYSDEVASSSSGDTTVNDTVIRRDPEGFGNRVVKTQDEDDEFSGQLALYLHGNEDIADHSATAGFVSACINYIDKIDDNDSLKFQYYVGTWQALTQDTVKLTMEDGAVKVDATMVVEGNRNLRFIFKGKDSIWTNDDPASDDNGFYGWDPAHIPNDSQGTIDINSCESLLTTTPFTS